MRSIRFFALTLVVSLAAGCASPLAGTWVADKSTTPVSPIAEVSFCEDGTFTAHAEYGDNSSHTGSGHYEYRGGKLKLDASGSTREYDVKVAGSEMHIIHDGKTFKMSRIK